MGSFNNINIPKNIFEKMAKDPAFAARYEEELRSVPKNTEQSLAAHDKLGMKVLARGATVDKSGKITYWAIACDKEPKKAKPSEYQNPVYDTKIHDKIKKERAKKKEELELLIEKRNDKKLSETHFDESSELNIKA